MRSRNSLKNGLRRTYTCKQQKKVDFFFLWSTASANLSPSSGAMKQRRGIFLQVNTYLVNDILEENGEGQCRVLQLV